MTESCVQSGYEGSGIEERALRRNIVASRRLPACGIATLAKDLDALYSKGEHEAVVRRGLEETFPSGAAYCVVLKSLLALQRFEEALEVFGKVSIRDEHWARILHHAGTATLLLRGRLPLNMDIFFKEIEACPQDPESYRCLAEALLLLCPPRARFAAGLKRLPSTADPQRLLEILIDQAVICGDLEEALFLLQRNATGTSTETFSFSMRGRIAEAERDFDAAEEYYRAALTNSRNDLPALALYVFLLGRKERWDEARCCFRRKYEQVRELWQRRFVSLHTPFWDGGELAGKSIVLDSCVGPGYGDLVQMSRFTAELKQRGANVTVLAPRPIHSLMRRMSSIDRVFERSDVPQGDCCADYLMLWLLMDTPVPGSVSGYSFPSVREATKRPNLKGGLRIGLAWRAQNGHVRNLYTHRSIDLCKLGPLLELPSTEWVSLQYKVTEAERKLLHQKRVSTPAIPDFLDMADEMSRLDLVVSADTSMIHLAGALGMKGYCLLPFSPDWRWGEGAAACSWYPTIELRTQNRPGDWESAIAEVGDAVKRNLARS